MIKGEFTAWYCEDCEKIYKEKQGCCTEVIGGDGRESICCEGAIKSIIIGDFLGENLNYCIERKNGQDFISSLAENHIYIQLQAMYEFFGSCCALLVEGSLEDIIMNERRRVTKEVAILNKQGRIKEAKQRWRNLEARISQMLSIPATCMQLGISFIQTANINTTIKMLKYFDYKCGAEYKVRDKRKKLSDLMPSLVKHLMATDGLGIKMALAIFAKIKTQEELIAALKFEPNILLDIKRFGPKKLKNLQTDWNV